MILCQRSGKASSFVDLQPEGFEAHGSPCDVRGAETDGKDEVVHALRQQAAIRQLGQRGEITFTRRIDLGAAGHRDVIFCARLTQPESFEHLGLALDLQ